MKYKDWSDFVVHCSGIDKIMSRPRGLKSVTDKERAKFEKFLLKEELSEADVDFIEKIKIKEAREKDPELSNTAIKYLMRRYAWEKYNKKVIATGIGSVYALKGNQLEGEAIELLSRIDGVKYEKWKEPVNNGYILGVCDVYHNDSRKVIDVKTTWNVNTFLPYLKAPLDRAYWFQMQGYMELHNADSAEVCFVLMNTPIELIDREKDRLSTKYLTGEINREKYSEEMENLSFAFNYDKIPEKRRIIRHIVPRFREIVPVIYSRVNKCRIWLNEFEKVHILNKQIIVPPDKYVKHQKDDDNSEFDTSDPRSSDEG